MLSGLGRTRCVVVTGDTLEARGDGGEGQASTSICQLVKHGVGKINKWRALGQEVWWNHREKQEGCRKETSRELAEKLRK